MKELRVQKYLREGNTLDDLKREYGINASRHSKFPNLVGLKYNQIESPMGSKLVHECRGLVLNEEANWSVVARPFDKFFNAEEGPAAEIDWTTARVLEKVDGSLLFAYLYKGETQVGTTGTPDAGGPVGGFYNGFGRATFADLFWEAWDGSVRFEFQKEHFCLFQGRYLTVMFELTSQYNRIVVPHQYPSLTLLGVRFNDTGEEWHPSAFGDKFKGVAWVKEFPLTTIDEIRRSFDHIDGLNQEGYVVVDAAFNRIKIKHPQYVALHHLKDRFTVRKAVELVRDGEAPELIAYFPELHRELMMIQERYDMVVKEITDLWELYGSIQSQKEFATIIKDSPVRAALFAIRSGHASSAKDFLKRATVDSVMRMLGLKVINPESESPPEPDLPATSEGLPSRQGQKIGKGVSRFGRKGR